MPTASLLASGTGVATNPFTTAAMTLAGGTLVIAIAGEEDFTLTSVVDSDSNVLSTAVIKNDSGNNTTVAICYFLNRAAGASKTITVTLAGIVGQYINYQVYELTGWTRTPEVLAGVSSDALTNAAPSSGAVAGTRPDQCRIAAVGNFAGSSYTLPTFGGAAGHGFYPTGTFHGTFYDTFTSNPGTIAAACTQSASGAWSCAQAVFESAPPSVALTGTAIASITEADIVTGGKTIVLTLTGDTWIP